MPQGRNQGVDLTGRKFGRLVVLGKCSDGAHRSWECRCDCGNAVFTDSNKLTTGQKKSCGCLLVEIRLERAADRTRTEEQRERLKVAARQNRPRGECCVKGCHEPEQSMAFCSHHYDFWNRLGHPLADQLADRRKLTSSGKSKEVKAWSAMKSRCYNRNIRAYSGYGGRGISVCARWLNSFDDFLRDMGKAPAGTSLERLDVNGDYEPENCKWGTPREQMRNTRYTKLSAEVVASLKARYAAGERVVNLAKELGVSYGAVYAATSGRSWTDIEPAGSG